MISLDKVQLYMNLFAGRRDVYARRWERNGKIGYSPAYSFSWPEFMAHKQNGGTMSTFTNKTSLPVTMEVIQKHLEGDEYLGLYPLRADGTCHLIAVDFDKTTWKDDASAFVTTAKEVGVDVSLEVSRSGNGAHVWIFFADWYPAVKARTIVQLLLDKTFCYSSQEETSYDRMFPNQDFLEEGGIGNLVALPLQGKLIADDKSVFIDPTKLLPYPDQWAYLGTVCRMPVTSLDQIHDKLMAVTKTPIETKTEMMNIRLGKLITLQKAGVPVELSRYLKSELNLLNPGYMIKERMGLSTYKTERFFKLIRESAGEIAIPRGFLSSLKAYCDGHKIKYSIIDERLELPEIKYKSTIKPYDYQQDTIDEVLEHDCGVIVAPPGSGKTVVGLSLVTEHKLPALILVHRAQLLSQWKDRITQFLGIPKKEIGQYSGSKKKLGKQVNVAMMQTLTRLDPNEIAQIASKFGTIIIDECHHIPASTFREVIVQFAPRYLYGLTATPQRKNHDEALIFDYIGPTIATMQPQAIETSHFLSNANPTQPTTSLTIHESKLEVPFTPKVDQYDLLSKLIIFNDVRNHQIIADILKLTTKGLKVLVLTERKDHVDVLQLYLRGKAEIVTLTGDDSTKSRREKLITIEQGNFQILLATGQLLGEGFDLPILDALVLAYPFSFEGKLIQYVGRVERGSTARIIYDYNDLLTPTLAKMFKLRLRHYKKRGWI
jgi:superfamily II DNA or RNA helicase